MSTLADAFVRLRPDTKTLGPELKAQTEGKAAAAGTAAGHRFGASMVSAIKKAGAVLAVGGLLAVKGFLLPAIQQASDLNETASKSATIFGKNAASIQKWADTANKSMGLTRQQAMANAASFGDMFQQLKIAPGRSAAMSKSLVALSADFASFHNADITQVLEAQSAAFRGEYDSIQKFVPAINAARVQSEAMRATHKKSAKDLTEADKAMAVYNILLKDTTSAQGDFKKTSAGLANQQRILKAGWGDLQATVGQALLPVMTQLVATLNEKVMPVLNELWATHGKQVVAWLQKMAAGVGPGIGKLVDKISSVDWPGVLERAKNMFAQLGPAMKSTAGETSLLHDTVSVGATVFKFLADNIDLVGKALPYLIGAFVLYKGAQAASNATQVFALPIQAAAAVASWRQGTALRAHTIALSQNTAAQRVNSASTKASTAAENIGILAKVRAVATTVAQKVATIATSVATKAWAVVQGAFNLVMSLNPIGLVVIAIAALVAGIIYAYKNSETFRKIVDRAFLGIKLAIKATVDWVVGTAWPFIKRVFESWALSVKILWTFVSTWFGRIVGFVAGIPGKIKAAANGMWDGIVAAAKGAVNKVLSIWNRLDLGFTIKVPDWVPGVGGKGFTVDDLFPDIPLLARGGVVKAKRGGTAAIMAEAGEDEIASPVSLMRQMIAEAVAAGRGGDIKLRVIADNKALQALFDLIEFAVERVEGRTADAMAGGPR